MTLRHLLPILFFFCFAACTPLSPPHIVSAEITGEEVPEDLLLAGNYWGSVDPQEISSHFFDGQQSDYLGRVRFEPFLHTPPPSPESACNP